MPGTPGHRGRDSKLSAPPASANPLAEFHLLWHAAGDALQAILGLLLHQGLARGTGLGLFIAKKALDQHGGRIGAVSEPGQGSTFRI